MGMPKILGVTGRVEDPEDFPNDTTFTTVIGVVIASPTGSGGVTIDWFPTGCMECVDLVYNAPSLAEAAPLADAKLRALLAAVVEPIAKRLDDEAKTLVAENTAGQHWEAGEANGFRGAAEMVRAFYAPDAKESGDGR